MKRIFILTGETSGDKLASIVVQKLKKLNPNIDYLCVGGSHLKSLGIKSIFDLKEITFMGFTLSLHDHEYVSMGTMIHRPVELGLLAIIYAMGEIHLAFFIFMFMGVPLPAGICLWLWRKETQVSSMGEYWQVLAHPDKERTLLGKWIETLGWIVLAFGAAVLLEPSWLLEILGISQAPLVLGYVRVAGWAWMIVGWCYFMNARHEHRAFFDIVFVKVIKFRKIIKQ